MVDKESFIIQMENWVDNAYRKALINFWDSFNKENVNLNMLKTAANYFNGSAVSGKTISAETMKRIYAEIYNDAIHQHRSVDVDELALSIERARETLTAYVDDKTMQLNDEVTSAYNILKNNIEYDSDKELINLYEIKKPALIKRNAIEHYENTRFDTYINKLIDNGEVYISNTPDENGVRPHMVSNAFLNSNEKATRIINTLSLFMRYAKEEHNTGMYYTISELYNNIADRIEAFIDQNGKEQIQPIINAFNGFSNEFDVTVNKNESILAELGTHDSFYEIIYPLIDIGVINKTDSGLVMASDSDIEELLNSVDNLRDVAKRCVSNLFKEILRQLNKIGPVNYTPGLPEMESIIESDGVTVEFLPMSSQLYSQIFKYFKLIRTPEYESLCSKVGVSKLNTYNEMLFRMCILSNTFYRLFDGKHPKNITEKQIVDEIKDVTRCYKLNGVYPNAIFNSKMNFTSKTPITKFDEFVLNNVNLYEFVTDCNSLILHGQVIDDVNTPHGAEVIDDLENIGIVSDKSSNNLLLNHFYINDDSINDPRMIYSLYHDSLMPWYSSVIDNGDETSELILRKVLTDIYSVFNTADTNIPLKTKYKMDDGSNVMLDVTTVKIPDNIKKFAKYISSPYELLREIYFSGKMDGIIRYVDNSWVFNADCDETRLAGFIRKLRVYVYYTSYYAFSKYVDGVDKTPIGFMLPYYKTIKDLLNTYVANGNEQIDGDIKNINVITKTNRIVVEGVCLLD